MTEPTKRSPFSSQARDSLAPAQARLTGRLVGGLSAAIFLMILVALVVSMFESSSRWPVLLSSNAAALILLAISLFNAQRICQWRAGKFAPVPEPEAQTEPAPPPTIYQRLGALIPVNFSRINALLKSDGIWLASMALFVLFVAQVGFATQYLALDEGNLRWVAVGIITTAMFTTLVAERHLAATVDEAWPEAKFIAPLLRLALAVQCLTLIALIFPAANLPLLVDLPAMLVILVALEFLLRGLFSLFTPPKEADSEPDFLAKSQLAAQLVWPPRPLLFLQRELHQHFGIDLRQLWAFTVLRRAFLPVLTVMLICGWLLTGLQQISATQRGIYERFGKPVKVLSSGLHYGLPWPFGQVVLTENGQVHELATGEEPGTTAEPLTSAEGEAPQSADRLWDAVHSFDKAQIIASQSGSQQSLQIINSDVRFMWRIGLTDNAALAATYNSANLPELIRSAANQVLVHQFSSQTLEQLLAEQRIALASQINRAVQQKLDSLQSGVELLSTVVEAIHPPAGAADAFHGVQAAQISAQALISRERGHAAELAASAQTTATTRQNQAQMNASDVTSKAQATAVRFAAQKQAVAQSGQVFIDELWYSQLHQTLGHSPLLIIDQRIGAGSPPTIDLREFPSLNDAARRDAPSKPTQESSR
ncbi:stomatin/prohibitin family membrane protease [Buttiauxella ferragutiae ATCC 51602]|jgi:regulator of protease activity HflC (stomatin/prohibitin superfamily)|uniref:Stomatin/prohibitin family membrane protease n=2 Tax=Buttiauxella ferragutiae TaxID=82989 RepID=A0ABX2WDM4_9ENTR|nr:MULTISPECIES: protease modulator HflK [Buttiauxella]OAT33141.1 stomatin/prohibitin family membrane protease [Buttiauxella ferragutiae ATCC 51602]TDN49444.1 regulator of protease activity HflC (stomatin/prohibitin superfamily) [Buttiauxella sp. JUb87]